MTEVLFSDPATHYLVQGRIANETLLYAITKSEVTVISRIVVPDTVTDSRLLLQATQINDELGTFLMTPLILSQVDTPDQMKTEIIRFIDQMVSTTATVEGYISDNSRSVAADMTEGNELELAPTVLTHLKTYLDTAKTQIMNNEV